MKIACFIPHEMRILCSFGMRPEERALYAVKPHFLTQPIRKAVNMQ